MIGGRNALFRWWKSNAAAAAAEVKCFDGR